MIRLLLVDDQALFRQGLHGLLRLEADFDIVGEAENGQQAIELVAQLQPDVVLMDIRMPVCNGVEATKAIHQSYPWVRILVLTTFDEDEYVWPSLQAGALGYLLKSTPAKQVADAVRTVAQGHSQLGPTIASKVFSQLGQPIISSNLNATDGLSSSEVEIVKLIGVGQSNREIAKILNLSEGTVRNYVSNILQHLNLRDRTQVALWFKEHFPNGKA
jgi:DNA-binding NarL/FixJ family response regulator